MAFRDIAGYVLLSSSLAELSVYHLSVSCDHQQHNSTGMDLQLYRAARTDWDGWQISSCSRTNSAMSVEPCHSLGTRCPSYAFQM